MGIITWSALPSYQMSCLILKLQEVNLKDKTISELRQIFKHNNKTKKIGVYFLKNIKRYKRKKQVDAVLAGQVGALTAEELNLGNCCRDDKIFKRKRKYS